MQAAYELSENTTEQKTRKPVPGGSVAANRETLKRLSPEWELGRIKMLLKLSATGVHPMKRLTFNSQRNFKFRFIN